MEIEDTFHQFIERVKKLEKGEKLDLSSDEDLSVGVMNLISLEEHFYFTYNKTKKDEYLDLLNQIREMRKSLLKKLIKEYEGEVWCISKHLLATSMRLMEVGTKALTKGDKESAKDLFQKSYQLYSLFWGLNLGMIKTSSINSVKHTQFENPNNDFIKDTVPAEEKPIAAASNVEVILSDKQTTIFDKLGRFVQKMIDCCKE